MSLEVLLDDLRTDVAKCAQKEHLSIADDLLWNRQILCLERTLDLLRQCQKDIKTLSAAMGRDYLATQTELVEIRRSITGLKRDAPEALDVPLKDEGARSYSITKPSLKRWAWDPVKKQKVLQTRSNSMEEYVGPVVDLTQE